jgi:heme/copper-type cytochrome/quinol oxidase subunit 2
MKNCGLFLKNNFIAFCDAPEAWQLGFQDPATPVMQGIIDLHHDIFFFIVAIVLFVLIVGLSSWKIINREKTDLDTIKGKENNEPVGS